MLITLVFSIISFRSKKIFEWAVFMPVLIKKEKSYYRFLTSGFIHANWLHLILNVYVLYVFGHAVETNFKLFFGKFSGLYFVIMYLTAIIISEIPLYIKNRNNPEYASLGASGAVSAIVFSFIMFQPTGSIGIILLPITLPSVLLGVLFLLYSAYMSKYGSDNIAHSAHFTGALYGFIFPVIISIEVLYSFLTQINQIIK